MPKKFENPLQIIAKKIAAKRAAIAAKRAQVRVPEECKTLQDAVDRVHGDDRLTTIVVGKGEHQISGWYLMITSAMNIVGDPKVPKSEIVVLGGIYFKRRIQGNCHLQHMTLRQAKGSGVYADSSFTMDDVLVENCGDQGVVARGVVGRCTNVEVRKCGKSGVYASNGASITLIGDETMVHHNCTDRDSTDFGLIVSGASTIQLVSPLTQEKVSVDNHGGRNWSVNGDIYQIMSEEEIKAAAAAAEVRVPEECKTLKEAVDRVDRDDGLTTIVVGKGEYQIADNYLKIASAMNIVGDPKVPKSEIVVVGGIYFSPAMKPLEDIPVYHLQHLTLRQAKEDGVFGNSSFTMEDVLVEQCDHDGVVAWGNGVVGTCTNVEVRQCGMSGVVAEIGASITLIGAKTTVHHNCTKGDSDHYGLVVDGSSSSTIQLVSPLTKEQVSLDNGGGGNWGASHGAKIDQIKNISQASTKMSGERFNLRMF